VRKLFPSARGLENTWHSIVKIQQSLYREVRRCLLLPVVLRKVPFALPLCSFKDR